MTASASAAPAVRAAFTHLVDYAGLFPPAKLEMAPAAAEYLAAREGPDAWMLGRFIVPASRVGELLESLPHTEPVALSVIVDAGAEPRTWLPNVQSSLAALSALRASEPRVRLQSLEAALPPLPAMRESYDAAIGQFAAARNRAGLSDLPAFVELPRDDRWKSELPRALFAMHRHDVHAKLRCGGVVAEAFPSCEDVADFICAAREEQVAFKATAGLHHPVRRPDPQTGAVMHGFVNVLAAAAFARGGLPAQDVLGALACEDGERLQFTQDGLSWDGRHVSTADLAAVREQAFVSYGSCSFAEPTDDLRAMGLI